MAASILATLKEQIELMELLAQSGQPDEDLNHAREQSLTTLLAGIINNGNLARSDGITMMRELLRSKFTSAQRGELVSTINAAIAQSPAAGPGHRSDVLGATRMQLQVLFFFQRYANQKCSETLGVRAVPYSVKLDILKTLLLNLGASNLSEKSMVHIVAYWILLEIMESRGVENDPVIDAQAAYCRVHDLRTAIKAAAKKQKLPHYGEVSMFPSAPAKLQANAMLLNFPWAWFRSPV